MYEPARDRGTRGDGRADAAEHGHAQGPAAGACRKAGCHSPAQGHTRQRGDLPPRVEPVLMRVERARRKGTLWQREKGPLCRVVVATWPDGAERREATSRRVPINAFSSVERGPSGSVGRP